MYDEKRLMRPDSIPVNIALLWHSAISDNLGLGALTVGHLAILRAVAEALPGIDGADLRFEIVGSADPGPHYITDPDVAVVGVRTRHLVMPHGPLIAALRRADLVSDIGGGDSFTDLYGPRRAIVLSFVKLLALLLGRPLILSPQTIGPFNRRWARWLATRVMNRRSRWWPEKSASWRKTARKPPKR